MRPQFASAIGAVGCVVPTVVLELVVELALL